MPSLPSGRAIDAVWLSQQLGVSVEAIDVEPLGVPQGFTSSTMRLRIKGTSDDLPQSLILKIDSDNPQSREVALALNCFRREVGFYRQFASQLTGLVPYGHATGDGTSDDSRWLLLEDLTAMKAGNQVRGISAEACSLVLDAIAKVHAHFWNSSQLEGHDWLPNHQLWFQGTTEILGSFHSRFLEDYELRVDQEALHTIALVIEKSQAIDLAMATRPSTLVHGDLRIENVLFGHAPLQPDVVLLDWGTPTRSLAALDLAYLIGGSVPMPARRGRIRKLVEGWHRALQRHGVMDYSLSEAWSDVQLASLRCLSTVLFQHNWQLDHKVSPRVILLQDEWIERSCSLVVEINALEALPSAP